MTNEEAIRLLKAMMNEMVLVFDRDRKEALNMAIEALKAQPETSTEIQEILNYLDTTLHPIVSPDNWYVYAELHDMVSMLPSAQRWIPCSERLPAPESKEQRRGFYLTTNGYGSVGVTRYEFYNDFQKTGWQNDIRIDAWMPLPEPYKDTQ